MDSDTDADLLRARVCRGAGAIMEAFSAMGREGKTDHDLAKSIVQSETDIRALVDYALEQIRTS